VREICGLRDPDGSGEGQFVVDDGGRRAFAWIGFRLGHNGKRGNGFLEASSSSAIKLYEHLRKHRPTRPKTSTVLSHSYPPNHENHTNQTNSATTMLSPSTNPTTPPQKICITIIPPLNPSSTSTTTPFNNPYMLT